MQPLFVNVRPVTYRTFYRPMPYPVRSAVLAAPPRLGQKESVTPSLVLATAGLGGFFLSSLLPTPWDLVGKGLSVLAVGYSFYRVLAPSAAEKTTSDTGTKVGPVTPIPRTEDFDTIQGSIISPRMYSTISYNYFTGTYPVEILVGYPRAESEEAAKLQKPVTFSLQLEAVETPNYRYTGVGDKSTGIVASEPITLNPGDQVPITLKPATITSTFMTQPRMSMTLNLYKVRTTAQGNQNSTGRAKMATTTFFMG